MNREAFERHLVWAESWRNKAYRCPGGKITVGVGRNLDDKGLTDTEVRYLLDNDVAEVEREAQSLPYYGALDEVRQLVVCDLIFNLGLTRWLGFVNANAALAAHDYETAALEMVDSRWYRQVGRRAERLVRAMRTGEWVD